jgi:hypothetical protein
MLMANPQNIGGNAPLQRPDCRFLDNDSTPWSILSEISEGFFAKKRHPDTANVHLPKLQGEKIPATDPR